VIAADGTGPETATEDEVAVEVVEHAVDDGAVVVYESRDEDETETVVIYESEPDDDSETDLVVVGGDVVGGDVVGGDAEADLVIVDDSESEVVEETEAELVAENHEAEAVVVVAEPEPVVVAEPEPEPEPEPVVEAPAELAADDRTPQPKTGKGTLKRLLWGAGSRSGE